MKERDKASRYLMKHAPGSFQYDNLGPGQIVAACADTYAKEFARLIRDSELEGPDVRKRAGDLWRAVLPDILDRRTTTAYIACIAWGSKMQILSPVEAKTMMFMAQTQLTVLKAMSDNPERSTAPPEGGLFAEAERAPQSAMEPTPEQDHR
jgi:hypothetical protein